MPVSPLQAAQDVLARAIALLSLDSGTAGAPLLEYDCRRQAVAMGVAALDTWMHWSIRNTDLSALSKRLHNLDVPFGELVAMGNYSIDARQRGVRDRPGVRARNVLNAKLLTMTFQTARQWEVGFGLLGIRSGLSSAGSAMTPKQTHSAVTEKLNALSHRRNMIVHEGDLVRLVRPRNIQRARLPRPEVDADLAWVGSFLSAVDTLR